MSLLLDALKEAETRRRRAPAEHAAAPAAATVSTPAAAEATGVMSDLALEDEVLSAPPQRPQPRASTERPAALPPREVPSVPQLPPPRIPAWRLYILVAVLPLIAALYWVLFHNAAAPVPQQVPPLGTSVLPAPADEAETPAVPAPTMSGPAIAVVAGQPSGTVRAVTPRTLESSSPAVAPVAAEPQPPPTPAPVFVQRTASPLTPAHDALRAGDLARAEALYRQVLATEPDQPDARLGMALVEQTRGARAEALDHYRVVLQRRPEDPQAWAGMADLADDGELVAMESRLRYLIANRSDPALQFALGNVLARQSRWPESQQAFFAAATGAPLNADYVFNLAVSLDRLGKGQAALPHYVRALELARDGRSVQFDADAVRARMARIGGGAP